MCMYYVYGVCGVCYVYGVNVCTKDQKEGCRLLYVTESTDEQWQVMRTMLDA